MCNSCIGIEWGEYNVLNEYLENRRLVMTPGGPEISKVDPSVKTLSRLV
jgi:hypothetical protein